MNSLLDHVQLGNLKLKNRIVMPPMQTGLATEKGEVTEKLIEHYTLRSKFLGLLIVEHSYISIEGKISVKQLGIYDDFHIEGLSKLTEAIHSLKTPIILQLNHAGRVASQKITGIKPISPCLTEDTREISLEEMNFLSDKFVMAADRALKANFDGVEIHGAHGFLLNQFFSPITNKRKDSYGGSIENRMKLPLLTIKKVRKKIGNKILSYRLGSDDLNPEGTSIKDSKKFAVKLEKAGIDVLNISGGICGSRPPQLSGKEGYFIPQAYEIKKVVDIPVIGVGGITRPEYANKIIKLGFVDLIAVGRSILYDTNWVEKAIKTLKSKKIL